jgi:glycosyltransferase involved in cell wall biosynthesis
MICGAAVVATDIGGHREFCTEDVTAILVPSKAPELMANAVLRLINDNNLRLSIAHAGESAIQKFTWDAAVDAFELALLNPSTETVNI